MRISVLEDALNVLLDVKVVMDQDLTNVQNVVQMVQISIIYKFKLINALLNVMMDNLLIL
jgi:hypothetical protein